MATIIADYLRGRAQDAENKRQFNISSLLSAAGLAKDVWSTLQDQNAYKPGGYLREYDTFKAGLDLQGKKDWQDYVNTHPEKPAQQLYDEWLGTPEGIASEARKTAQAKGLYTYQTNEDIRKAQADNPAAADMFSKADDKIANVLKLNPNYLVRYPVMKDDGTPYLDPATGQPAYEEKVGTQYIQAIKDAVLSWARNAYPKNVGAIKDYLDNTWAPSVSDTGGTVTADQGTAGAPVDWTSIFNTIAGAYKGYVPQYNTNKFSIADEKQAESNLEAGLSGVIPYLQGQDQATAQEALKESQKAGLLGADKYALLYKVLEILKTKIPAPKSTAQTLRD